MCEGESAGEWPNIIGGLMEGLGIQHMFLCSSFMLEAHTAHTIPKSVQHRMLFPYCPEVSIL